MGSIKLNHIILWLCKAPSISLSFILANVLPRRITYALTAVLNQLNSPKPGYHNLQLEITRVSNPFHSSSFRNSTSVLTQPNAFAIGVPSNIYTFHCYIRNSLSLFHTQVAQFSAQPQGWALRFHTKLVQPSTHALRPIISINARAPCITAAAGTELAGAYSLDTVMSSSLIKEVYEPKSFILHTVSLYQTFVHCRKFPTAAFRKSTNLVSISLWLVSLSRQLLIVALDRLLPLPTS